MQEYIRTLKKLDKTTPAYEAGFLAAVRALEAGTYFCATCINGMPPEYRDAHGSPIHKSEAQEYIAGWKDAKE